jgi:PTS system nitrogen regulatory IIA component
MPLTEILVPEAVLPQLKVSSKKQLLRELADQAGLVFKLDAPLIFEALLQRERLGSTGIGKGIAIPHGKFEALDHEPVDLVFLLLAPENAGADHLKALAKIARILRDPSTVQALRHSRDQDALYALLTRIPNSHAA